MADPVGLCQYCAQIPFRSLECPTSEDVLNMAMLRKKQWRPSMHSLLPYTGGEPEEIPSILSPLGSLARIKSSSASCRLCNFFLKIIYRRWPWGVLRDDLILTALCNEYYGVVTASEADCEGRHNDSYFILRRLSLRTDSEQPPSAYIPHVAQACNATDVFLNDAQGAPTTSRRMLFAGRKRDRFIDINLLQQWIKICESDLHEETCHANMQALCGKA